jgi:hypothetical protein
VLLQLQDKRARHVAVLEKKAALKFKTDMTDKNNTIEVTPIVLSSFQVMHFYTNCIVFFL